MQEFKSTGRDFSRRTRRRVAAELAVLSALAACAYLGIFGSFPRWAAWSVLGIGAAYILVGLAFYRRAKADAEAFAIILLDEGISFRPRGDGRRVLYGDLQISKVKRRNGEVVEIWLRTKFGQRIALRGLENMGELSDSLARHVRSGS